MNNKLINVADISVYDYGSGIVEIINANSKGILVKFILLTACYESQIYSRDAYLEPIQIEWTEIEELKDFRQWDEDKVVSERAAYMKQDEPMFARYAACMGPQSELDKAS